MIARSEERLASERRWLSLDEIPIRVRLKPIFDEPLVSCGIGWRRELGQAENRTHDIVPVEMVVVPDKNAVVARVLAGDVDFVNYSDIPIAQAAVLKDQWEATGAGAIITALVVNRGLVFQYRDVPRRQRALDDVRVRQAIMHAIDREEVGRLETVGLAGASDTPYFPEHYLWPRIDAAITRYPFDVRRSEALLAEAGWRKAGSTGEPRSGTCAGSPPASIMRTAAGSCTAM